MLKKAMSTRTHLKPAQGEHTARLYRLAYLITGDRELSVHAIGAGLNFNTEDLKLRTLAVAAAAFNEIHPQLKQSILLFEESLRNGFEAGAPRPPMGSVCESLTSNQVERALLAMDVFQRCVVLLTVLERFSDAEAGKALSIDERLVVQARVQGLIALTRNVTSAGDGDVVSDPPRPKKFCCASIN